MFCQQMEIALVLCLFSGMALGRHTMNVATVGEPMLSFDPFALSSVSGTAASASSSGASASAASTAGNSRTSSVSSSVSRIQRPGSGSSVSASPRQRAFITTINGQNVLVVPSGAQTGRGNLASRTPSGSNLRNSNMGNGQGTLISSDSGFNLSPLQQLQLPQQQQQQNSLLQPAPPGLQFLGRSGNVFLSGQAPLQTQLIAQPLQQTADGIFIDMNTGQQVFGQHVLQQNGGNVIFSGQAPLRTQIVAQPLQQTAGGVFIDANTGQQVFGQNLQQQNGGGLIFVNNQPLQTQGNQIFDSVVQAATPGTTPGQTSFSLQGIPIPNSQELRLIGLTPRGDVIIDGPGGTITIGAEVLNSIISPNAFPVATEFDELENELLRGFRGNKNKVKVLDPGNGAIMIEKKTAAGRHNGGSGLKTAETASSSSAAAGGTSAVAAASASASTGGASASASAGSASASSNSLTGRVVLGNGVTLNNGVITIDSAAVNSEVNIGGSSLGQPSSGASGIPTPGNATILITG